MGKGYPGLGGKLMECYGLLGFSLKIGLVVFFIAFVIGASAESNHFSWTQLLAYAFAAGFSTAAVIVVVLRVYEFFRKRSELAATIAPFILIALLLLILLFSGYIKIT